MAKVTVKAMVKDLKRVIKVVTKRQPVIRVARVITISMVISPVTRRVMESTARRYDHDDQNFGHHGPHRIKFGTST